MMPLSLKVSGRELRAALQQLGYLHPYLDDLPLLDPTESTRSVLLSSPLADTDGGVLAEHVPLLETLGSPLYVADVFRCAAGLSAPENFALYVDRTDTEQVVQVTAEHGIFHCRSLGTFNDAMHELEELIRPVPPRSATPWTSDRYSSDQALALFAAADVVRQRRLVASLERSIGAVSMEVTDFDLMLQIENGWEAADTDWAVTAARCTSPREFPSRPTTSLTEALRAILAIDEDGRLAGVGAALCSAMSSLVSTTLVVSRGAQADHQRSFWCASDASWMLEDHAEGLAITPLRDVVLLLMELMMTESVLPRERVGAPASGEQKSSLADTSESASPDTAAEPTVSHVEIDGFFWVDESVELRSDGNEPNGRLDPGNWYKVLQAAPDFVLTTDQSGATGWVSIRLVKQDD